MQHKIINLMQTGENRINLMFDNLFKIIITKRTDIKGIMQRCLLIIVLFGLLIGPYIPFEITSHIAQKPILWIIRTILLIIFLLFVSSLIKYIKKVSDVEKTKAYENVFTGYPNFNKWKYDYNVLCEKFPGKRCSFVLFEFENFDIINRYTNHEIGNQSSIKLLEMAEQYFKNGKVYSITKKKFIIMLQNTSVVETSRLADRFLLATKKTIYIDDIPVPVVLKGGIDYFKINEINISNILDNLEKALDQSQRFKHDLTIYNKQMAIERQDYYNTMVSIYRALQNDSFYLIYQPKIYVNSGEVEGVEALLRCKNDFENISISQIINIAEEVDLINNITKWVIKNVLKQLQDWQLSGKFINVSINISARDLCDYSLFKYVKDTIKFYGIDARYLEFELTERSIIENEKDVFNILNDFKNLGIKISLDDYGTGYNSLMYLIKNVFQFDFVKIDRVFINEITSPNTQALLEGVIQAAHGLGIKIIAEGVECEEQLKILQNMGCDIIQGYYYSKPLLPLDFDHFLTNKKIAV